MESCIEVEPIGIKHTGRLTQYTMINLFYAECTHVLVQRLAMLVLCHSRRAIIGSSISHHCRAPLRELAKFKEIKKSRDNCGSG